MIQLRRFCNIDGKIPIMYMFKRIILLIICGCIIIYGFVIDVEHIEYPNKISVYMDDITGVYIKNIDCGTLWQGTADSASTIVDKSEIKKFISIMTDNKNFLFLKNKQPIDARTSYSYYMNGHFNCLCFDAVGYMQRNDSLFKSSEEVKKYLLDNKRICGPVNYKGLYFSVSGIVKGQDTKLPIRGDTVRIIGSDSSSTFTITDSNGKYEFDSTFVKPHTAYIIYCFESNTFPSDNTSKVAISTVGQKKSKDFVKNLFYPSKK